MASKINYQKVIENDSEREFYRELHEKVLDYLSNKEFATFWKIVREIGGSDRRVLRLLDQMRLIGEIKLENKKISLFKKQSDNLTIDFTKIKNIMSKIHKVKPNPTFLYDQRPITLDTTINRAQYLFLKGDLIEKSIAIIGDDDLTSLSIGLTKKAKSVIVFDIDERLVKFINQIAKKEKINVKAFVCDFTLDIPQRFKGKFDVFLTDPTPNPECFSLFISIGLGLLKKGKGFVGYVSFFPSHQEITIDFQQILTNKRVIVTDMIPKFTQYDFIKETYKSGDIGLLKKFDSNEDKLSFTENLTRIETTKDTMNDIDIINADVKDKILGKATKRVLNHIEKDPAYIRGESNFVLSVAEKIRRNLDE